MIRVLESEGRREEPRNTKGVQMMQLAHSLYQALQKPEVQWREPGCHVRVREVGRVRVG